jgi:hypothetical protein
MKSFDEEGNMRFILEEIKKTDTFYNAFEKEFSEIIFQIIRDFYSVAQMTDQMDSLLLSYSVAILNSTESVIDKDRNYPFYRLEEEMEAMDRITSKLLPAEENTAFEEIIHQKAKELMVKHFVGIFDLSSIGFRLLERNAKLYNSEFISGLIKALMEST